MKQRAEFVGELALKATTRGGTGEVTRAFPSAVYVRSKDDFVLLLWGGPRSPMTINLPKGKGAMGQRLVGEEVRFQEGRLEFDGATIITGSARVHRGSLRRKTELGFPGQSALVKGVTMLRSLYDVSSSGELLVKDSAFDSFVRKSLIPYASGRGRGVYDFRSYGGLIGRGTGFTPAGDDFIAGFVATFNFIARNRRTEQVRIPRRALLSKTVPESGAIVAHAADGHVDEGLERLILSSLTFKQGGFYNELLAVASRGHTSGVDMALGVLLCEAAAAGRERRDRTLEKCVARF